MTTSTSLARPYAKAAFEIAKEQSAFSEWGERLYFSAHVSSHNGVAQILRNPRLTAKERADVFIEMSDNRFDDTFKSLIRLLAENNRLALIPEIAGLYEQYRAEAERTIKVKVRSAVALDEEQRIRMKNALSKKLERNVELECEIDASVLGGAIIQAGDLVIDGSMRNKINRLGDALSE